MVENLALQFVWQVLLGHPVVLICMWVHVAFAMAKSLGVTACITKVVWNFSGCSFLFYALEGVEEAHCTVALWCGRQIECCMGEMVAAFRHTNHVERCGIGLDDDYCIWICKSNVLACTYHHAAEYEPWVLSCIHHFGKPIECGVRVASSERFYEGAYDVEVIVAFLVVQNRLALDAFLRRLL